MIQQNTLAMDNHFIAVLQILLPPNFWIGTADRQKFFGSKIKIVFLNSESNT